MNHYAGLDVSLNSTRVCVVDEAGRITREATTLSEPEVPVAFFGELDGKLVRIALEAGTLSQWLHDGMAEAGLPMVCADV